MELRFRRWKIGDIKSQILKKEADTSIYLEDTIDQSTGTTHDFSFSGDHSDVDECSDIEEELPKVRRLFHFYVTTQISKFWEGFE
jgi:hypothetical protein